MARLLFAIALAVGVVGLSAPRAHAGDSSPAVRAKVKRHIKRARAAYDAGRLDQAVKEYQAAYALLPVPDIQFNLGQIERVKGDPQQAIAAYRRYLDGAPDGGHADEARRQIAALTQGLVPVALQSKYESVKTRFQDYQQAHGHDLDDKWDEIDRAVGSGDTLNLGDQLDGLGSEIDRREHPIAPEETRAAAAKVAAAAPAPAPRREKPYLKKWWFWTAIGGGAALLITGIAVGAALGSRVSDPVPTIGVVK